MKLKSVLFAICLSLIGQAFAANVHLNPKAEEADKKSVAKEAMYPGYCEIEIINDSPTNISVFGTFDDGSSIAFDIYRFDAPHYISLYYYGYCHGGMYLTIQYLYGTIYSSWTNVGSTIHIVPYLAKNAKAGQSLKAEVTSR